MKKNTTKTTVNRLLEAITLNRGLAVIDTTSRQVLDNFSTSEVGSMIRDIMGIKPQPKNESKYAKTKALIPHNYDNFLRTELHD